MNKKEGEQSIVFTVKDDVTIKNYLFKQKRRKNLFLVQSTIVRISSLQKTTTYYSKKKKTLYISDSQRRLLQNRSKIRFSENRVQQTRRKHSHSPSCTVSLSPSLSVTLEVWPSEGSKSPGNTNSRVPSNTINLSSGGGGTSSFDSRCFVGVERGGIRNLGSSPGRACKNQSNRGDLRGGSGPGREKEIIL